MKNKKSQQDITNAASAAGLIILIIGIIVGYIIIMPPQERARLLEEENDEPEADDKRPSVPGKDVLLSEHPGRVDYIRERDIDHEISAFRLYTTTSSEEIDRINPFIIRNSLFDTVNREARFRIRDLDNTDNVMLSFSLKDYSGILEIKLNDVSIFQSEITEKNPGPVLLKKEYLKEDNVLEFSVSGTGIRFWKTNLYSFENIKIVGDVTDVSRQESTNVFSIRREDVGNIESATLRFFPDCDPRQVGRLEVKVNYREVFSGVPDCGSINIRNIPSHAFLGGENNIVFKTDKGDYLIEQIKITTRMREAPYPLYYFYINETWHEKIVKDEVSAKLTMRFIDDKKANRLSLNINNRMTSIDTLESLFIRNINRDLVRGNNFIKIEPLATLDIIEIKIEIE